MHYLFAGLLAFGLLGFSGFTLAQEPEPTQKAHEGHHKDCDCEKKCDCKKKGKKKCDGSCKLHKHDHDHKKEEKKEG